jgi:hypothetical protein
MKISKKEIKKFRVAIYTATQEALAIPTAWMDKMFPGWKPKKKH